MKNFALNVSALALLAASAFAGENFGGIGVTIYATPSGVRVVDVIPGSPAALAGIESDDRILAVDGVSLAGNSLDASKDILRGTVGKPLELSVLREKDTLSVTLRRARILVSEIAEGDVRDWYGEKQDVYSPDEIAEVARQSLAGDYTLLSVMKDGRVVPDSINVSATELSSVSVENPNVENKPVVKSRTVRAAGSLEYMDREQVSVNLRAEGSTAVRIVSANGEVIERLFKKDAKAGSQTFDWNGKGAASGRYIVHIDQNDASSAVSVELR